MKIFGIKEHGIKKYQSGTQEGGIQKQSEEEKFNQYLEQMKKQYPGIYTDSTPVWNYIKSSKEMKSYNEFLNDLKSTNPEEYNRLMENAAGSGTSEISKPWIDSEGNVRRSTNVGAGFVSGTDPIGSIYVENAVLNKPIGHLINRLGKYFKLLTLNKTYTGVPDKIADGTNKSMVDLFPNYKGTVWTTNNIDYARTFDGPERTVFKVFGSNKGVMDTPTPDKGSFFGWQTLPFKMEKFKVIKGPTKQYKRYLNKVDDTGKEYTETGSVELPDYVNQLDFKPIGVRTDDVVNWSKDLGYNGVKFHKIHDGTIWKYELPIDEPIDEIVYNSGKDLIKVPLQTSDWNASKFVQTKIGNRVSPIISTTNNILRTNDRN